MGTTATSHIRRMVAAAANNSTIANNCQKVDPRLFFKGRFTLVDSLNTEEEQISHQDALNTLIQEAKELSTTGDGAGFIGVDTETKRAFERNAQYPATLLQLSTRNFCVMYRLHKLNNILPEDLLSVLEDSSLFKVGVGIIDDMTTLAYEQEQINTIRGCVDLDVVARQFPDLRRENKEGYIMSHGLESLSDKLFLDNQRKVLVGGSPNGKFIKDKSVSISDWSQDVLTTRQLNYAATDAWISYEVAEALSIKRNVEMEKNGEKKSFSPISITVSNNQEVLWPKRSVKLTYEDNNHKGKKQLINKMPPATIDQPLRTRIFETIKLFSETSSDNYMIFPNGLTPKSRYHIHQYVSEVDNVISVSTGDQNRNGGRARITHIFKLTKEEMKSMKYLKDEVDMFININMFIDKNEKLNKDQTFNEKFSHILIPMFKFDAVVNGTRGYKIDPALIIARDIIRKRMFKFDASQPGFHAYRTSNGKEIKLKKDEK